MQWVSNAFFEWETCRSRSRRPRSPSVEENKTWGDEYEEEDRGVSPPRGAPVPTFNSRCVGKVEIAAIAICLVVETFSPSLLSMIDCQPAEDEEVSISLTIKANSDSLAGSGDFAILELQSLQCEWLDPLIFG